MGNQMDWDSLAEQLGTRLYAYFKRRHVGDASGDLTQETLIRLYNKVQNGSFDEKRGDLSQLAFGIAGFVILEHMKSQVSHRVIDESAGEVEILDSQIEKAQKQRIVRKAISELPLIQQEVLALTMDEELTLKQISEILDQPENTIKSHIHRSKENLRNKLQSIWRDL